MIFSVKKPGMMVKIKKDWSKEHIQMMEHNQVYCDEGKDSE